jgi:hypothetical protein
MEDMDEINCQEILNSIDLNKINETEKKKRGRPKKTNQMINLLPKFKVIPEKKVESDEEDEIILHLPITKAELLEINSSKYSINDIVENKNMSESISENKINNSVCNDNKLDNNKPDNNKPDDNKLNDIKPNDNYIKQLGMIIKKLKEENEELKKYLNDITPMYNTEVKVYPINLKLFDIHQNKLIPIKTTICCWWCTYQFDNLPTYLPEKYSNDIFHVSGCFCSLNCAGSYNLSLNDDKVWERYSLLKLLYYMINIENINSINDIEINISGPKELLEKYGGPLKIEEYRKNSKILGREYHKLIPPFLPLNFGFEEITNSKTDKNINLSHLIQSSNKNDNIFIKRNKPINNIVSRQIDNYV